MAPGPLIDGAVVLGPPVLEGDAPGLAVHSVGRATVPGPPLLRGDAPALAVRLGGKATLPGPPVLEGGALGLFEGGCLTGWITCLGRCEFTNRGVGDGGRWGGIGIDSC